MHPDSAFQRHRGEGLKLDANAAGASEEKNPCEKSKHNGLKFLWGQLRLTDWEEEKANRSGGTDSRSGWGERPNPKDTANKSRERDSNHST